MKKFAAVLLGETSALAWTLGGTALVLITLSGETQKTGLYISIGSFVVHMVGVCSITPLKNPMLPRKPKLNSKIGVYQIRSTKWFTPSLN